MENAIVEGPFKNRAGLTDNSRIAPEFAGISGWINSLPLSLLTLRGRVVFLDFWTFSCVNCLRTIPHVIDLDRKYAPKGLVVIGVHTPEFEHEKDPASVAAAVERLKITYPVALDSENTTWRLYGNMYWPRQTLVGFAGDVRYEHIGEGGYEELEVQVAGLLSEAAAQARLDKPLNR